ncbi:MAG: deoxyguanosinetriphosphate triphosphohydrolase [Verrucomicrobia bacterium]|nr:deoxyguanosinetriphosphate triphosphohydrolase [Verrucomicrobiota bacterium]
MLRSYAQCSSDSLGRAIPEPEHPFRSCFQRDRDRIVHSTAFRRLDGKTQVFLNGKGDYYRTRLTHTIEVASISRTIARALGLNEDLVEAIALAHDLGHSPSGHEGEKTLNKLMASHGGFDHNEQSLRVVELLEESYPQHPGLNLSYEVLEGLRKHHAHFETPHGKIYPSPSLEAQVADMADAIAYNNHDLDDGLESGLLLPQQLDQLTVWQRAKHQAFKELGYKTDNRAFLRRCFMNHQVEALITHSRAAIAAAGVDSIEQVRQSSQTLIGFNQVQQKENQELRNFLAQHLENHPDISTQHHEACYKIERLFQHFLTNPEQLGYHYISRIEIDGKHRAVCDYIAGMTDRYVKLHYDSL